MQDKKRTFLSIWPYITEIPSSTHPVSFVVYLWNCSAPLRNGTADFVMFWQLCRLGLEVGMRDLGLAPQQQEELLLPAGCAGIYSRANSQHPILLFHCHKRRIITYIPSIWLTCKSECEKKHIVPLLLSCIHMASRYKLQSPNGSTQYLSDALK